MWGWHSLVARFPLKVSGDALLRTGDSVSVSARKGGEDSAKGHAKHISLHNLLLLFLYLAVNPIRYEGHKTFYVYFISHRIQYLISAPPMIWCFQADRHLFRA